MYAGPSLSAGPDTCGSVQSSVVCLPLPPPVGDVATVPELVNLLDHSIRGSVLFWDPRGVPGPRSSALATRIKDRAALPPRHLHPGTGRGRWMLTAVASDKLVGHLRPRLGTCHAAAGPHTRHYPCTQGCGLDQMSGRYPLLFTCT